MRLIDADALKESLDKDVLSDPNCPLFVASEVDQYIDSMPSVNAEPVRHGTWIPTEYDSYADGYPVYELWECSECRNEHEGDADTLTAYCPHCGAKMDGGNENGTD